MQVYTEKEWDKVRPEISGTKFPIRAKEKPAQAAALERNVAHQGFDSVLQFAHDPRSGITISSPEELGIDYQQILEDVQAKLGVTIENPNDLLPLEERVCSIIPMDGILKDAFEQNRIILNDVKGNKKSLIPFTHLSDYYQNILMKGEEIGALKRNTPEAAEIRERIKESLSRAIAHELGVACDQPILFFDDNDNPINIFDCMYQDIDMLRVPGEYREIKNSYELKDLDTNIETRDFAGSDKQSRSELRYRCEGKDGEKIEGCPIITDCSTNNRIDPFGSFGVSAYYKFDKYVIGEHEKKYNSKTYMFYIFDLEKGEFYGLCDKNDIVIESLPDIFQVMVKDGVMVVLSKDNKGPEPFCWITIRAYDLSTGQEILHSRRYDGYEYESFKLSARSIIVSRTSGHRYEANPPDIILHFNKISASRHLLDFEANKKQKDFEARLIRELTILCNKHADEQVGEKFFVYWGASPDSQGEGLEVDPKDFIFTSWYRGKRLAMERYVATEEGVLIIHEPEVDYRKERIFGYKKGNPLLNIGVSNSNERRWYFYVTKEFYDFLKSNNMLQKFNYTMESNYPRRNRTEDRLDLLRQGIYFLVEGQEPPEEIRLLVDEKDKPSKPSRRVGKKAPGKSPEAALQIIADDPSLQFKMFSEDDYLASYKTRYGKFKFEAPAPGKTLEDNESALRTVRRDLHEGADALARGNNPVLHVLQQNQAKEWVIVPVDKIERGKKIMYKLTDEGMRRTAPASVHKEKITPQEERRLALAETIAPKVLVYDQEKINSEFAKESLRVMNETLKEYLDKIIAYLILEAGTPAVDMNKMEVIKQVAIGSLERQHAVIKDAAAKKAHEELEKLMAGIAIDIVQTVRHDANALIREKILNPKFIEARLNEINYTAPGRAINAQEISMIPEMRDDLIARYFGIANVNFMLTDGFLRFLVNESTQKKVGGIVSGGSPVDALVLLAVATANPVDFTYLEHKDIITKEAFSSVSDR
ncbi:MAG TPA: hypothetical protein PKL77_11345, partial [Candidatus Omnitrophota bacterium]|nr:hypothetical protein [Candidatus Omnitrophota bacterium]